MSRSIVVLPQPDGPSRKKSSCSWTSSEISLSTTASPNFLVRFWIEMRMVLVECKRAVVLLALDPRPAALGDSPIFLLRPGLPLDFLLVANDGILPKASRQLECFGFGDRHASQLHAIGFGQTPPNHRGPGAL